MRPTDGSAFVLPVTDAEFSVIEDEREDEDRTEGLENLF